MNRILKELCAIPTAPYREQRIIEYIEHFARQHRLDLKRDDYGNLLLTARPGRPRWVMVAHMDHPGMIAAGKLPRGLLKATFRGYVLANHLRNTPVVFQDGRRAVRGTIVRALAGERGNATEVHLRMEGDLAPGSPGMFDLEVASERRGLLHSRALDDLAGVAAALQAILNAKKARSSDGAAALLTRAEEDGFIGAIAAASEGKLISKTDRIISIECSAMQSYALQGEGAIIRVGDKASIFDSAMTHQLSEAAADLAKQDDSFLFQRALMPGGTCEATAFGLYGYRAAAVCVPLGNYHNMIPGKKQIAAEYIHLGDWDCLVRLLTTVITRKPEDRLASLQDRLKKQFATRKRLLSAPPKATLPAT